MATDVVMPQMGESIAEGTIVRWIKKVGDRVDRDEPLFEISTDKVDAEIPSPAAGVVSEIRVKEGETVPVNSVVAVIGGAGGAVAAEPPAAKASAPVSAPTTSEAAPARQAAAKAPEAPKPSAHADGSPTATAPPTGQTAPGPKSTEDLIRERSSPLVRKIAKEHNVDISQIRGSGIAGRVTKDDILAFVEGGKAVVEGGKAGRQEGQEGQERLEGKVGRSEGKVGRTEGKPEGKPEAQLPSIPVPPAPKFTPGAGDVVEKMSPMRKRIAEHMILSRRTSAHVHSIFEVNFSRLAQIREARKSEFERAGAKLTYMSFIIKAAVDALRVVPVVNASVDGDSIVYHQEVNVGVAVALDWGLIVPVVKQADEKNLLGLSRAVADLANRARNKQLKPDEVQGGTFTITNPGVFGALLGTPIINQPQVAILGVGNVEKRPVVIDDAIAIRPMAYLTLGYDHRVIDGAVADHFMSQLKRQLENWDANAV
ncbi:MAG TPA: dihydrolipoamide acetyltransferase family protein [Vicinamibacterales bacterium]|nr:dihydrolipoamide acetyltransferase family protein [Vicinamibacterales bacterium]